MLHQTRSNHVARDFKRKRASFVACMGLASFACGPKRVDDVPLAASLNLSGHGILARM